MNQNEIAEEVISHRIYAVSSGAILEISGCTHMYKSLIPGAVEGQMHKHAIKLSDEQKQEAIRQVTEAMKEFFQ